MYVTMTVTLRIWWTKLSNTELLLSKKRTKYCKSDTIFENSTISYNRNALISFARRINGDKSYIILNFKHSLLLINFWHLLILFLKEKFILSMQLLAFGILSLLLGFYPLRLRQNQHLQCKEKKACCSMRCDKRKGTRQQFV